MRGIQTMATCRLCGTKLSALKRLFRSEYCNDLHQAAYQREQNQLGLARLLETPSKPAVGIRLEECDRRVKKPTYHGIFPAVRC